MVLIRGINRNGDMLRHTVPDSEETQKGEKMRLIDIDELELDAEYSDYIGDYTAYSKMQIDFAMDVQAITIDWIEDYLYEHENQAIEEMLMKWKREQREKRKCRVA